MNAPKPPLRVAHPVPDDEPVTFRADKAKLSGRLFRPGAVPKAAIVLHGATGVPHRYYGAFAAWLAEQGYACLIYDYRDFGASANRHPRQSNATMSDWGLRDQPAAQAELERLVPDVPVWIIGHSLGGLMLPFQDGAERVARMITVASGPVHLSDHPLSYQPVARVFWSRMTVGVTRAIGYLPGRVLRIGPNLPAGVYAEWRRWCTTPGFYLGDVGHTLPVPDWGAMRGDMKLVAISDDKMVPPAAVWRLMQSYPEAHKKQLTLRPSDFGLRKIGHIAAFAPRNSSVWPTIIA